MRPRLQFVITAIALCHLFRGVPLVISQAHPEAAASQQSAAPGQISSKVQISATEGEPLSIKANQSEEQGGVYTLRGNVEIQFRDYTLRADTITYDKSSGDVTAEGHISFDGGPHDMHMTASHGIYNIHSQTGKFYDVSGTTGARFKGRNVTLTSSNPIVFTGRMVEQTGPEEYVIHHGSVTSCEVPHPKWTFNAETIVIRIGTSAKVRNSTF